MLSSAATRRNPFPSRDERRTVSRSLESRKVNEAGDELEDGLEDKLEDGQEAI